jgi:Leucine-rich repeat (LRR) protein
VLQYNRDAQIEETIALIIGHISSFNSLKSLRIALLGNDLEFDIARLESLTELTELELIEVDSLDLLFVSGLKKLKKLKITYASALISIKPIAGLPQLEELDLSWSRELGSDYASILPGMKKLKRLNLYLSELNDVSFLKGMVQLERLNIRMCSVRDISSLSGLPIYSDKHKLIWDDSYGPGRLDPRTV